MPRLQALAWTALSLFGFACSTPPLPSLASERRPLDAASEEVDWRAHPYHLSAVVGGTLAEDEEHAPTLGLDFEYRLSDLLGVGAVFEHAVHPLEATTLLATVDLHLWRGLALQTGPGAVVNDDETLFAYRFGLLYEFELGNNLTLSPQLHYDLQDGGPDEFVYVVALGVAF